jgi:hypothetical protein
MPEETDQINIHRKSSFWEHHLGRWQQSGLSQRAYCRQNDLRPHQFYYWRRRILKPRPDVSFLPVTLPRRFGSTPSRRPHPHAQWVCY